jgi:hypothetical protein
MKKLMLKTMLVISLVTLTSVLAWSVPPVADPNDPCKNWKPDAICSAADPALKLTHGTEATSPEAAYPGKKCESGSCPEIKSISDVQISAQTMRPSASGATGEADGGVRGRQ